ncbi:MAG: sigma-54-dependent Fis family transcriptional regulator [Deltaproteobacteria bacterium]|nr:sigma-54-dependent Fis family transcriptional regulator [Deltaproteobacteria bacterium]
MRTVLVVSAEENIFGEIKACFPKDYLVGIASDTRGALEILRKRRYDVVFIDLEMLKEPFAGNGYKSGFQPFWHIYPSIEIIVMSAPESIREAVMAVKSGASNYITYPINKDEVRYVCESLYQLVLTQSELDYLRDQSWWERGSLEFVQTKSPVMKKVFDKVHSVAPTKSTVLLTGETGTGKGMLAKLIHRHSNRRDGSFISVHCGAIPDSLVESELFGHEKGSFTGAIKRKLGKFEIAKGGTIFLDEIGTITPSAQIKLLQVLQDGIFSRVGGEENIDADVRVIAATNHDLKRMSENGEFRKDLYYRLNVFPVEVPPLRERKEDLRSLVEVILKRLNRFNAKEIHDVEPCVLEAFDRYDWPGNIRELENLMERGYILATASMLKPEDFPQELFDAVSGLSLAIPSASVTLGEFRRRGIEQLEKQYLKEILARSRGKIKESALSAGITPRQLNKLMTKYKVRKEEFKSARGS